MMKKLVVSILFFVGFVFTNAQNEDDKIDKDLMTWYHKDFSQTNIYGINTQNAIKFLESKSLKPKTVVVGVLDGGVEIDHPGLKNNIWKNPNEVPGNGKDDDNNGYIDDVHGWNFIGGKNEDVAFDNLEKTRIVSQYQPLFEGKNSAENKANQQKLNKEFLMYMDAKTEFLKESVEAKQNLQYYTAFVNEIPKVVALLKGKSFTKENLSAIRPTDSKEAQYLSILSGFLKDEKAIGKSPTDFQKHIEDQFKDGIKYFDEQTKYHYNLEYNSRAIIGDNYNNLDEKNYGNNHYEGTDASHGTHVAGIIAGIPNGKEIQYGVAHKVAKIMTVRTVPNGDERDKDVANSIKYAVDNGAKIINMSFGKSYSPNKEKVWEILKYAQDKGVLLVHAAGNDNKDVEKEDNFPTNFKNKTDEKSFLNNYITVGASTNDNEFLRADFSNFSGKMVDVFAPGLFIYSTIPDGKYKYEQGTSMAAPVVSGAAAVLLAYMPTLKPEQIIESLVKTANKSTVNAMLPTNINNRFDLISRAGGVIDLRKAAEYAFTNFYKSETTSTILKKSPVKKKITPKTIKKK